MPDAERQETSARPGFLGGAAPPSEGHRHRPGAWDPLQASHEVTPQAPALYPCGLEALWPGLRGWVTPMFQGPAEQQTAHGRPGCLPCL